MWNCFPVQVDVAEWRVGPGTGKMWKDWMSQGWFAFFTLHALYKLWTLLLVLLSDHATPLYQIILHAVLVGCSMTDVFWYYLLFIKYGHDFATFVSITLAGNITGGTESE